MSSVAIWICTFANNQFGEDFGPGLNASPFYKAIMTAEGGTVLIVDRDSSSLLRIWCGLELHLTSILEKDLCLLSLSMSLSSVLSAFSFVFLLFDFLFVRTSRSTPPWARLERR